jgi:3-dehydroquinate synthase
VAIGCALAFAFSAERGLCPPADAARVAAHLTAVGLSASPTGIAPGAAPLIAHMMQDKKMAGGTLAFVLARRIGAAFVARDVALADVAAFLDRELASH